ncbi:aldehyde dehydrogenase family protein [Roseiterribacter gracilis]|uniref:Aldehyde dehydrogenase n=1 Tax=Roseiterribacter gracilis TaxID=2812848 RepID=A0A8S8XK54_9PROT|nr:aldehyde dehydrogenase [Rhodospirillales bacterium TMPK1]
MSQTVTLAHYVDGKRVDAAATLPSLNPSDTSDIVALMPDGDASVVALAVDAARRAFPGWSATTPEQRFDILDRAGDLILTRRDVLGRLLSREEGKTLAEGTGEVVRAGRIFKFFAGEALRNAGRFLDSVRPGVEVTAIREAVGVFGLITPWNFPIAIPVWKTAPALAFGNTVVLKPSELTPAMASALADILHEAGLPAGVFNLVFGTGAAGAALCAHADVDGLSFTGSQATGARVATAAAARQARVQLEMGGKNPLVILADADLDRAVMCALDGAFFASGQRCTASSRLIVEDAIHDRFVDTLAARAAALKVGDALDTATQIGPLVSQAQLDKVQSYLDVAPREGGRVLATGAVPGKGGYYLAPTVVADTTLAMRVNREEIFGPVASVIRVSGFDAALAAANDGAFGLSAGIVTQSLHAAQQFRRRVRAGMVMVNLPTAGVDYHVPFGGTRKSSYGQREQGFAAVDFYTQYKTIYSWA